MLLVAAVVLGTAGEVINKAAGNPSKLPKREMLELGGLVIVLWIVAAVLLAFAISRFNRARRADRRERERAGAREVAVEHLARAGRLAGDLLAGGLPELARMWDVVLRPGERLLLDGSATYSRYYGLGARSSGTGAHTGPTAHLVDGARGGAFAGAGSGGRAQPVAVAAAARWRDQQPCRVVLSDQRLMCQDRGKGWLSFEHREVSMIEASSDTSSVVLEFPGAAPVRLSGPLAAEIVVVVVWALFGAEGLREHPALALVRPLLPPAAVLEPVAAGESVSAPAPVAGPIDSEAEIRSDVAAGDHGDEVQAAVAGLVDVLVFVAGHELVLAEHVAELLRVGVPEATGRLDGLLEQGLISRVRLSPRSPAAYRITAMGAGRVDPAVPGARRLDSTGYRRAVAAGFSAVRERRPTEADVEGSLPQTET
ncbi:MAG: hypothetical protein ACRDNS_19130 [Trebonia sp.]